MMKTQLKFKLNLPAPSPSLKLKYLVIFIFIFQSSSEALEPITCPSFPFSLVSLGPPQSNFKSLEASGDEALSRHDYTEAVGFYTSALSLTFPSLSKTEIYSKRSIAYLKLEEPGLAFMDTKTIIDLRPHWPEGYVRRGNVLASEKHYAAAVSSYNQALGLNPSDQEVKKLRDEFQKKELEKHQEMINIPIESVKETLNRLKVPCKGIEECDAKSADLVMDTKLVIMTHPDPRVVALGYVFVANRMCTGEEVKADFELARPIYEYAIELSQNPEAVYRLSMLYLNGQGGSKDPQEAKEMLEELADFPASTKTEETFKINSKEASKRVYILSERHNFFVIAAQLMLGKICREENDFKGALSWFVKASDRGSGQGAHEIAMIYQDGLGVKKDEEKKIQFLELAAGRGHSLSMFKLAHHYLGQFEIDKAQNWYLEALDVGDPNAVSGTIEFESLIAATRSKMAGYDELSQVQSKVNDSTIPRSLAFEWSWEGRWWAQEGKVRQMASKGFKHAQKILNAMIHFRKGREALLAWSDEKDVGNFKNHKKLKMASEILREFASSMRLKDEVISLTPQEREEIQMIVDRIFEQKSSDALLERDARIVHSFLLVVKNSLREAVEFLSMSKLKYPEEIFFHVKAMEMVAHVGGGKGADMAAESLKLFPHDPDLLYYNAEYSRAFLNVDEDEEDLEQEESMDMEQREILKKLRENYETNIEDVKKAYHTFLKFAPKDHNKVPEAYYSLGLLTAMAPDILKREGKIEEKKKIGIEEIKELFKIFEFCGKGLIAEMNLLPAYLPYDSGAKKDCERFKNEIGELNSQLGDLLESLGGKSEEPGWDFSKIFSKFL